MGALDGLLDQVKQAITNHTSGTKGFDPSNLFDHLGDLFGNHPHNNTPLPASQDPYGMGKLAVETGYAIMQGKKPENPMILMASHLVTRDNVGSYQGWSR